MRSLTVFLIGVGSMVAASCAFALAMTDESPISASPWLVPAVVVLAGAFAAIVDRRPCSLATVLCGACAAVVGYAAWLRLTQGPDIGISFALIGIGLALTALSVGFAPAAFIGWLAHGSRHGTQVRVRRGSAPGAQLSSEDWTRTGRPGEAAAGHVVD